MQPAVKVTDSSQFDEYQSPQRELAALPYSLVLGMGSLELTDHRLVKLFADNDNLRFELMAQGKLVIMAPLGETVAQKGLELAGQVRNWAKADGSGITYGASAGFRMSDGALYAPDVSWADRERRDTWRREQGALPEGEQSGLPGFCPRLRARVALSTLHFSEPAAKDAGVLGKQRTIGLAR